MNPTAKAYKELCERVARMSVEEKRAFYLEHFQWLVSVSSPELFGRVRVMCMAQSMIDQVGAEFCQQLLDMVNGHIALREMGMLKRK